MAPGDLVYTIAVDAPGSVVYTTMARMLVSSLLTTGFDGTIVVLAGTAAPFTPHPVPNVVALRLPDARADKTACDWKFRARGLIDAARYRKVLYLDCDCLAIEDVRPLLDGDWDVGVAPEYGAPVTLTYFNAFLTDDELHDRTEWGLNAGTFAIRGPVFAELTAAWERVMAERPQRPPWRSGSDQPAWNRVILDTARSVHAFDEGMVRLPFVARRPPPAATRSRIVHFAGVPAAAQLQAMCETYFDVFGVAPRLPD